MINTWDRYQTKKNMKLPLIIGSSKGLYLIKVLKVLKSEEQWLISYDIMGNLFNYMNCMCTYTDTRVYAYDLFIVWYLTPFSKIFELYGGGPCNYQRFPGVLLTNTQYNILSKPLAAFPYNHRRNNGKQ